MDNNLKQPNDAMKRQFKNWRERLNKSNFQPMKFGIPPTQTFSLKQRPSFNKPKLSDNWGSVLKMVYKYPDIRKAICIGCGHGTLIDKNGKKYGISGFDSLEKVELIINKILEINSEQPSGNSTS